MKLRYCYNGVQQVNIDDGQFVTTSWSVRNITHKNKNILDYKTFANIL